MNTRILIVDDEPDMLELMEDWFHTNGYETLTAQNGLEALETIREQEPNIIVSDLLMPKMSGMELLEVVNNEFPDISVIMVTAHGTVETAVEAMKKGAKDYILKPLHLDEILSKVETISQLNSLIRENRYLRDQLGEKFRFDKIIGKTQKMLELFELVKDIAPTTSTALIRGENGTGKELIANAIHFNSDRSKKPFIKVNCGVLADSLLESELFGHVKGAFTGAIKDKRGRFELADSGTIFLDEIGDVTPRMQIKLLRVLQEKEFEKVGGTETLKVDVRIIAATNRDLEEAMEKGEFRQDLYYRLNVIPIEVPPLRERRDDIPILVKHFIEKFNKEFGKSIQNIDDLAMESLISYRWPGNIRELENLIERAIVLSKSKVLTLKDFPGHIVSIETFPSVSINPEDTLTDMVDEFEKTIIIKALKTNNNNKLRTAEKLGIHRSTFMSKLKKYDIS